MIESGEWRQCQIRYYLPCKDRKMAQENCRVNNWLPPDLRCQDLVHDLWDTNVRKKV